MPYTYCVTFRIADRTIGGLSYTERRQQLVNNLYQEGYGFWDESTSFMLVQSDLQTPDLAKQAVKGLSAEHDLVFIFDPTDMSANYFGAVKHADVLVGFFPKAVRIL